MPISRQVPHAEIAKVLAERDGSEGGVRRITLYFTREGDVVGYGVGFNNDQTTGHMIDGRWEFEFNGQDRARANRRLEVSQNRPHHFVTYTKQMGGSWAYLLHETFAWRKR